MIFGDGRRVRARLLGTAPLLDVALLEVEAPGEGISPLRLEILRSGGRRVVPNDHFSSRAKKA